MKTTAAMKVTLECLAGLLAFHAAADTPTIRDVSIRQRWPWSRLVDIDYVLDCDATQRVDVTATAFQSGAPLALPAESLSGDLYNVSPGACRIVWNPAKSAYSNTVLTAFNVSLTPVPVPLYIIVNLINTQTVYVTESDLASGAWGTVQTNPVPGVNSIVWTGITNNTAYMTTNLVLRRIPSGQYMMGGSTSVTLTKESYVGVFEVTQAQWDTIMGSPSSTVTPVSGKSYLTIRGSSVGTNWPSSHAVDPDSFLGKLRERTGVTGFDLPTEAQWEYLCRAGTTSYYNDGVSTNSTNTDVLNAIAWWSGNSTAKKDVGKKLPNAWGLYDTIGNVMEWCLDWFGDALTGGTDPVGPPPGTLRAFRSGCYSTSAANARTTYRYNVAPNNTSAILGIRLVVNFP